MEMNTLNFNVKEKLQSLLDKSCTQTLRPAWKLEWQDDYTHGEHINCEVKVEKPSNFPIGEKFKLVWNKESKYEWFCKSHGLPAKDWVNAEEDDEDELCGDSLCRLNMKSFNEFRYFFNKLLGTGTATECFKIEIAKSDEARYKKYGYGWEVGKCFATFPNEIKETVTYLAKRDGFKDGVIPLKEGVTGSYSTETAAEQMFSYLDKKYDLSVAKPFWVKRWEWK